MVPTTRNRAKRVAYGVLILYTSELRGQGFETEPPWVPGPLPRPGGIITPGISL